MSQSGSHRVSVELTKGYEFLVRFDDVPGEPVMRCDEPPPLGGAEGPSPVDVLGAAIGNCLAASLTFCLRRAHVEPAHLTANVVTHLGRDDHGHLRIAGIDVEIDPGLDTENAAFKRCAVLFEDFCTVTASVRRGIPVSVSLRHRAQSVV